MPSVLNEVRKRPVLITFLGGNERARLYRLRRLRRRLAARRSRAGAGTSISSWQPVLRSADATGLCRVFLTRCGAMACRRPKRLARSERLWIAAVAATHKRGSADKITCDRLLKHPTACRLDIRWAIRNSENAINQLTPTGARPSRLSSLLKPHRSRAQSAC
jgi:hypothetical protein